MTEDEMVGWNHQLDRQEFEQALGLGDGQRSLVCCSPLDCKDLDMTERLNLTEPQCSLELFTIARTWKLTPWKEIYDQPRQHIEKQRHYFANKGPSSQGYAFSCGHVWM